MQQRKQEIVTADDEIDLRSIIGIVLANWLLLLLVSIGALLMGAAYSWGVTRTFSADATVQVELDNQGPFSAALGDMAEMLGSKTTHVSAEVQLIKSRFVMGKVVDELALDIGAVPQYFPLIGRPIARGFKPSTDTRLSPPLWDLADYAWGGEAIRVTAFEVPDRMLGWELLLTVHAEDYSISLDGAELFRGQVGERMKWQAPSGGEVSLFVQDVTARPGTSFVLTRIDKQEAIDKLLADLRVSETAKDSGVLSISIEDSDPVRARDIVNHVVNVYQKQNVERKSAEAEKTLEFLSEQLPELKSQVEAAEAELNNYRLQRGSADLTKETDLILQQSVELETARVQLEQKREEARQRFTPSHPIIQTYDAQLAQVRVELSGVQEQVMNLPETQQELLRLARDVDVNTSLYTSLLNSAQELRVAKAGTVGNVRIIDYAYTKNRADKPKIPLVMALSGLLGGMLGLVIIFLRHQFRNAVTDPAEVEVATGLPTYATVPYSKEQEKMASMLKRKVSKNGVLALQDPGNIAVEAVRSLRTSLHFSLLEGGNSNVVMLTGPSANIGKSFVSVNLGAVLALSGKKVLVIDADLRRGHLHRYLGCARSPGLSNYIVGDCDEDAIAHETAVQGLSLVPTGTIPPNPSELLLHERFNIFVKAAAAKFDYVILDSPPVLAVTDAAIVGRLAGCTLLVIKAGEHPLRDIEETARRLDLAGVNVRGTLFNQVGRGGYGYGYGYGYTYGKYGGDYKSIAK